MNVILKENNVPTQAGFYFFQGINNNTPVFTEVNFSFGEGCVITKKKTFYFKDFSEKTRWSDKIEFFYSEQKP